MKSILHILLYFENVAITRHIMTWLGLGLLTVALASGVLWPRVGFGFALWSFVFLLAVPAFSAPIALRNLLSNRRLMMMPRFADTAVVALFILTLLASVFLPFFAWLYEIQRFPDSAFVCGFVLLSCYLLITFILCGRQWAALVTGVLVAPVIVVVTNKLRNTGTLPSLGAEAQIALVIIVMLGWLVALRLASQVRPVRPAMVYGVPDQQMLAMGTRPAPTFWPGAVSKGAPALSLMMGYPATRFSVLRLQLSAGILGPLPMVLVIYFADFNQERIAWPDALRMLMLVYLFSATAVGFQNAGLVARLRLLWLRAPRLRSDLWNMLDSQHLLSQLTFLLLASLLALIAGFVSSFKPMLLLHYSLLSLALNAHTAYYSIYAKIAGWGVLPRLLVPGICLSISVWLMFRSIRSDTVIPLLMFETVLLGLALLWRQLGRTQFARIDWQMLKPMHVQQGMAS